MRSKVLIGIVFTAASLILVTPSGSYAQKGQENQPEKEKQGARVDLSSFQPWTGAAVGFGTQYGGTGLNFEIQLAPEVSLTAGIGNSEGFSMVVGGLRFYIPTPNEKFQIRISALGGNVAILEEERIWDDDKTSTKDGFAIGLGSIFLVTDFLYLNSGIYYVNAGTYREYDGWEQEKKTLEDTTFSVGMGLKLDLPQTNTTGKSLQNRE